MGQGPTMRIRHGKKGVLPKIGLCITIDRAADEAHLAKVARENPVRFEIKQDKSSPKTKRPF